MMRTLMTSWSQSKERLIEALSSALLASWRLLLSMLESGEERSGLDLGLSKMEGAIKVEEVVTVADLLCQGVGDIKDVG